ncbi:MAG: phage/plasmid primase, P4 family [bacterium]
MSGENRGIEIEKQIITTMVKKPELIENFLDAGLTENDLNYKKTRNIFNLLVTRHKNGKPIGPASIQAETGYLDHIISNFTFSPGEITEIINSIKARPTNELDSQGTKGQEQFEDFLPSPIAREIVRRERQNNRLWKYAASKELFYLYDSKGYWRNQDKQYLKKFVRKYLRSYKKKWDTNYRVNEVIAAMKSILLDPEEEKIFDAGYDPDLNHINFKNGMLDWKSGELKPHKPNYYSQFQLPIEYNPDATCPRWKKTLKEWVPEGQARQFLQEFTGYCLIPDTSMQKAIILHGSGRNGKSTFLNVLISLFGEDNLSNIPLHRFTGQAGRWETASIQDKLVNICSDIDAVYLKETGIIKTMIAGEPLRGEYKHGASFDFRPVVRLIFSANEIPRARDKSGAWYRRFEIIKFPNEFKNSDPGYDPFLEQKLKKELPGILNWALEGLQRFKRQGNFTESEAIQKAKNEYERQNDTVVAFVEDCTEFPVDCYEVCQKVFNSYKQYCENAGLKFTSRKTFTSKLKDLGFEVKNKWKESKTKRCYYGLRLK